MNQCNSWHKQLMIDSGWTARREFGLILGYVLIMYSLIHEHKDNKEHRNPFQVFYYLNKVFFRKGSFD